MSAIVVNRVSAQASATSVTTAAIITRSGSLLVAIPMAFTNKVGTTPITDSKGNTWVAAIAQQGNTQGWGAIFYCENCVGGSGHTFTFTPTASDFIVLAVVEITGMVLSGALNGTNFSTASGTTHSSGNVTAGATEELMVGAAACSKATEGTPAVANSFIGLVALGGSSFEGMAMGVKLLPASTTDQFQATESSAFNEFCGVASFKIDAASGEKSTPFIGMA